MLYLEDIEKTLETICPLKFSEAFKEKGHYDNSGTLIKIHKEVNKILFCLDLTEQSVSYAIKIKADTIITHHPAIYYPIANLSIENSTLPLIIAVKNDINVISMHLNLDIAIGGIDDSLAYGLGGTNLVTVEKMSDNIGYGKEFFIKDIAFQDFVNKIKKEFNTDRVLYYGNDKSIVKKVVSFCGGGSESSIKYSGQSDTIVTSDMPHHIIKELLERGKNIVILTHYSSENYGFRRFYNRISNVIGEKAECCYFDDLRFN